MVAVPGKFYVVTCYAMLQDFISGTRASFALASSNSVSLQPSCASLQILPNNVLISDPFC